jgi:hypothetical protein
MRTIRSFLVTISDRHGAELEQLSVPVEGAALFVNPLFRLLPGSDAQTLHEPWYTLTPRRLTTGPLHAPTIPAPTLPSITGLPPVTIEPDPDDPVRAVTVTLYDLDRLLYTADYTTTDVFGPLLTYLIQRRVADGRYRAEPGPFRLRVEAQVEGGDMQIFALIPDDARIEGVFPLPTPRRGGPRTSFQLVTQHQFESRTLVEFGETYMVNPELDGDHRVIWQPEAYRALMQTQPVSDRVEVGGYLIGQVYQQADAPETLLIEVQHVLAAVGTQASAALLLFTGDSWSMLRRRLAGEFQGLRLVGWWHTHLFPATADFGLSGLDETLHRQFFSSPWHVAALLNVSRDQGRVLRCYQPDSQKLLQESSYMVVGPRPSPPTTFHRQSTSETPDTQPETTEE